MLIIPLPFTLAETVLINGNTQIMKWPADRLLNTSPKSFGIYEKAMSMMEQGIDVIHLEVGRPNFDTPKHIKEATKQALDDGLVHYGEFPGTLKFRQALSEKLSVTNNITAGPDEILITSGLTQGAFITCITAIDPGDEVIVLGPYYPQHFNKVELAGGKLIVAPLDAAKGFQLDPEVIEAKITDKTRMIILVNPTNPTGRAFTRTELEGLAAIAIKHDLLVMCDEVYEQIIYDNSAHTSLASLPGMYERTITLFAFTKGYAMDGWRMGYAVACETFMKDLLKVSMNDMAHVNVFIQEGGFAAITGDQACVRDMVAEDLRRRDLVCSRLSAIPNVSCNLPEASIYAFPNVSAFGIPTAALVEEILEKTHVACEAGSFYGSCGEGHLRICFGAEPYERLETAMDRLTDFFSQKNETLG